MFCAVFMVTLVSCAPVPPPLPPAPVVDVEHVSCGTSDRLCLVFVNQMSPEFVFERLRIVLDGVDVFRTQEGLPASQFVYYSGPGTAGSHALQVLLRTKRGENHFEVRGAHSIEVAADDTRPSRFITVAYEKRSPILEERPSIRFIDPPTTATATPPAPQSAP